MSALISQSPSQFFQTSTNMSNETQWLFLLYGVEQRLAEWLWYSAPYAIKMPSLRVTLNKDKIIIHLNTISFIACWVELKTESGSWQAYQPCLCLHRAHLIPRRTWHLLCPSASTDRFQQTPSKMQQPYMIHLLDLCRYCSSRHPGFLRQKSVSFWLSRIIGICTWNLFGVEIPQRKSPNSISRLAPCFAQLFKKCGVVWEHSGSCISQADSHGACKNVIQTSKKPVLVRILNQWEWPCPKWLGWDSRLPGIKRLLESDDLRRLCCRLEWFCRFLPWQHPLV